MVGRKIVKESHPPPLSTQLYLKVDGNKNIQLTSRILSHPSSSFSSPSRTLVCIPFSAVILSSRKQRQLSSSVPPNIHIQNHRFTLSAGIRYFIHHTTTHKLLTGCD